ncbi:hypothetical protein [Ottowia thiooxydans]|uniref:hypothetical protein n=1 Tax=Ottowia thiooxydans TaxID=219182 RepID=UPI00048B039B
MRTENKKIHLISLSIFIILIIIGIYKFNCFESIFSKKFIDTFLFLTPSIFIALIFHIINPRAAVIGGCAITSILFIFAELNCTPYEGGGASMIEIAISMLTSIASLVGCFIGYFVFRTKNK